MNGNFWSRGLRAALISLIVLLLIWGAAALSGVGASNSDDDKDAGEVTLPPEAQKALTVRPGDLLPKAAQCTTGNKATFEWRSDANKKWSDSVSTPFKSSDEKEMLTEVLNENCTNPVTLDMNIQAIDKMVIGGFNVADANPWVGKFLEKAKSDGLNKSFLRYKSTSDKTIVVTPELQEYAAMANTIILNFKVDGVVKEKSVKNWHLPSLVAGEVPRTELNSKQEGLPVLRLEYTAKGQGCVFAYGYNKGDKRVEFLTCSTTKTTTRTPETGTPGTSTPTCKKHCTTTPPPKCRHDCETLNPKSGDKKDYQRPGTDDTTDSGTGEKPSVPKETKPADTTPPKVETKPAPTPTRSTPTPESGTTDGNVGE